VSPLRRVLRGVFHVVLPLAVLYGGYLGLSWFLATAPQAPRKPRPRVARAAEAVTFSRESVAPRLESMGLVMPAREVVVRARVGGRVEDVAELFETGGRFAAGDVLLQIEKADFELALSRAKVAVQEADAAVARARAERGQAEAVVGQRHSGLAEAEANLQLERGRQEIARREFEMLGGTGQTADRELALRAPQLAIAEAAVASSRAGLAAAEAAVEAFVAGEAAAAARYGAAVVDRTNAELDLDRTTVKAPFNAWIRRTHVEVGSVITSQTDVAALVGSDAYWVEVTLPVSDLRWLRLTRGAGGIGGEGGAPVVLRDEAAWGPDASRRGRLVRLLGDLESDGRLARVLVEVGDPLHLDAGPDERHPLLVGSYVSAEIEGRAIDDVVVVRRAWLRHGDVVWAADEHDVLRVRPVTVVWRGRSRAFLSDGLQPGDRVVVTDLGTPVDGMPLRVQLVAPEDEAAGADPEGEADGADGAGAR
jgi:hypothetical protein